MLLLAHYSARVVVWEGRLRRLEASEDTWTSDIRLPPPRANAQQSHTLLLLLGVARKMSDKMAFLLFGDQSLDTYAFLADFCGGAKSPSLLARSFLEQVGTALIKEVDQLSSIERQMVPRFTNVQELNDNYHKHENKNSAVDSALLCITQLAHYIE